MIAGIVSGLLICIDDISPTGQTISIITIVIGLIVYLLVMNEFFACSILTENTILFKHRMTGKKQSFPVGKLNKLVVDVDNLDQRKQNFLIIYANKKGGQVLGIGNGPLMALMKHYPHIPVVIKFFEVPFTLSRRTAKYIVKHQKTSKFKCKQLCEYYHLPKKLLEQADGENN